MAVFEHLDTAVALVDDLLVDAHRERRIRVAEEVHRSSGWQIDLGQDRGERAPQRVWVQRAIWRRQRAASNSFARYRAESL